MKNTPLDYLLHDVAIHQRVDPVAEQFFKLLTEFPLGVYYWPDWSPGQGEHLPADAAGDTFGPKASRFCLFTDNTLGGGKYHRPVVVSAVEGIIEVVPAYFAWTLDAVLVYRKDADTFDAIGIMRDTSGQRLLPEVQLRFSRSALGWSWKLSPSGFVNPYVYGPTFAAIPEDMTGRLHDEICHYGNMLSLFLGGYHKLLDADGTWTVQAPKQAKVKRDKHGRPKKFYRVASSGYMQFQPGPHGKQQNKICTEAVD